MEMDLTMPQTYEVDDDSGMMMDFNIDARSCRCWKCGKELESEMLVPVLKKIDHKLRYVEMSCMCLPCLVEYAGWTVHDRKLP